MTTPRLPQVNYQESYRACEKERKRLSERVESEPYFSVGWRERRKG